MNRAARRRAARLRPDFPLSDEVWFAANPYRQFRLRPLHPGEPYSVADGFVAPSGWDIWIITRRLASGLRSRHSVCVQSRFAADASTCDPLVRALYTLLVVNPTGDLVSTHEVAELAKRYARMN